MAYRIRAESEDGTARFNLLPGRNVVGSGSQCAVRLSHPTVSRAHALLHIDADGVLLEDLGSRNGTLLRSRMIEREPLTVGDVFVVGRVLLKLEEIAAEDLEVGIELVGGPEHEEGTVPAGADTTQIFSPLDRFSLDFLPQLLVKLEAGTDGVPFAQMLGAALFDALPPAAQVEIVELSGQGAVLYSAAHESAAIADPYWIQSDAAGCRIRVQFPSVNLGRRFRPIISSAAVLLSLSMRRMAKTSPVLAVDLDPAQRPQPASVSPEVQRIYDQAERVARGDVGVVIYGESGTGKEVLARFIHAASPRRSAAMVAINCASLPRDLLEAELFGVERGVATGVEARAGRFEQADGGTIFLDEIGDMAAETQAKILRVLQEQEVFRLGGHTPRPARARVIAATNRPIQRMLSEGTFRADLYHRIATWEVELPPLRRRRPDIPNLAAFFLSRQAERYNLRVPGISRAALDLLDSYHWPGNIRQLENEMARAVLFLENGEMLDTERLTDAIRGGSVNRAGTSLAAVLEAVERDEIVAAMHACGGDTAAAAERLEISRPTLYRRIKSLAIEVPKAERAS